MNKMYYINQKNRLEAMTTISFKRRIDWLEEGLSILSWNYSFVSETELDDLREIYSFFRKWKGNQNTKKIGRHTVSLGDIIITGDEGWVVVGTGFQKIPKALLEKINFQ